MEERKERKKRNLIEESLNALKKDEIKGDI